MMKPLLALVLVFCAGLAVGVIGTRRVVRMGWERAMADPKFANERVDKIREKMERDLNLHLELNAEQRGKIHQIFLQSTEQLRSLHSEFQPRMSEVFRDAHIKIAATLTPEQREKFQKITREQRERLERGKMLSRPSPGGRLPER